MCVREKLNPRQKPLFIRQRFTFVMPIREKRYVRDATFMIGSVTKLTLYAVLLAAAYKDVVEKRPSKDHLSGQRFESLVECISQKSRDPLHGESVSV